MGSHRWLTSRLDLVFCSSLSVLLDVNQIQGFKIWDPCVFWMLDFSGSSTLVFQVSDLITGGALLKFNLNQIWFVLISCLRISIICCASLDYGFTLFFHGFSLN